MAFRRKKGKRKKHFSDYIVAAAISATGLYTAAAVTLQFCGLMEISTFLNNKPYKSTILQIVYKQIPSSNVAKN